MLQDKIPQTQNQNKINLQSKNRTGYQKYHSRPSDMECLIKLLR